MCERCEHRPESFSGALGANRAVIDGVSQDDVGGGIGSRRRRRRSYPQMDADYRRLGGESAHVGGEVNV